MDIPDFANASSVQGLGQMVAVWAASVEARLAPSVPTEDVPVAPEA